MPKRTTSRFIQPNENHTMNDVDHFLNGRLPCSALEAELIEFARKQADSLAKAETEVADYKFVLGNRRDHQFVDACPDAEMPVRILQAYIESSHTVSMPEELGNAMNKWQAERNVIIRKAIDALTAFPALTQSHAKAVERIGELEKALTYIDRQVREVWSPLKEDTYQGVHRLWCIDQAREALFDINGIRKDLRARIKHQCGTDADHAPRQAGEERT